MSKISDLTPDAQNAKAHNPRNVGMIVNALHEVGAARSIVIDEDGNILAGNATIEAAAEAGIENLQIVEADGETIVAVRRTGLTDAQKTRLKYFDNRTAELADWNPDVILADLEAGVDLDGLFTDIELEDFGWEPDKAEDLGADMDKADELQEKWGVKRGDVFVIPSQSVAGKSHRILCGDSTSVEDVAKLMDGKRAELAVTSPPYGVGKSYETKGVGPWYETVRPVVGLLCKHADIVVWNIVDLYSTGSQFIEPTMAYSISMFTEHGFKPLWIRMWLKPGQNHGVGPYHLVSNKPVQEYEYVGAFAGREDAGGVVSDREDATDISDFEWLIGFAGPQHRFVRRLHRKERREWGYSGVWRMNTVQANKDHPALFPVELPTRAIKMHCDGGGLVLDPFTGGGTTIVAAEQTGRIGYGMEIAEKYVAVTLERLQGMGLSPELVSDG